MAVETPVDVGPAPTGHRRIVPITGGTMIGPALSGTVLPGGADFQVLHSPELTELDARYIVQAAGGALIHVHNSAIRHGAAADIARLNHGEEVDPAAIYFRCSLRFSTASKEWAWLNDVIGVGTGERFPDFVRIAVFIVR
ncbi:hypothetical protein GCM10007170_33050 [Arthrobacter liuii]|uniref:UPF0311 protein GCM10007170_33050 n=1 Tax=Arthrobacter liuii TaxID=1476996 RepID=A0ABQ2AVH9_9MICC|nr:hypothetical protein GCM10007170_33050 [Arthrobacter liuii]